MFLLHDIERYDTLVSNEVPYVRANTVRKENR